MDTLLYGRRSGATVLFEEDFDLPPRGNEPETAPEPEIIAPMFTAAELAAARDEAWREGGEQARADEAAAGETALRASLVAAAAQLAQTAAEATAIAEAAAEAIAHLLMAGFAAAFPALAARYGDGEVQAVLRKVLPALYSEPKVTIRVTPATASAVAEELARLDPDLAEQMQVVAVEGMLPGDVRVAWRAGQATRDTTRLWQDIEAILAPAGLLPPEPMRPEVPVPEASRPPASLPQVALSQAARPQTLTKETVDAD